MADTAPKPLQRIDFQTDPTRYHHWTLKIEGETGELVMDVDENAGLFEGYQLKFNSYDLGVDVELSDALQRLRFEHPEVKVVVLKSGKDKVFCAGANIRMLAGYAHSHEVNFCKFTNETRNGMEDSSENSAQKFLCAVRGTAAGGGYELALACDKIILADDGNSSVSLPEIPLLAVLPSTGGLTRITDKRKVRRDLSDAFCTTEEGVKGKRAVDWRLVDRVATNTKFDAEVAAMTAELAASVKKPAGAKGMALPPIERTISADAITYATVRVAIDRGGDDPWSRHGPARRCSGDGAKLHHTLNVGSADLHAEQAGASAFFPAKCDLAPRLRALHIATVLIAGLVMNVWCESSARDAVESKFRVGVLSDACAGHSHGMHKASLTTFYRCFGDVRPTADIVERIRLGVLHL